MVVEVFDILLKLGSLRRWRVVEARSLEFGRQTVIRAEGSHSPLVR